VRLRDEWIGEVREKESGVDKRGVELHCGSSTEAELEPGSIDVVLTDPPYFSNVQYAELMDFCYVWLRRLASGVENCFDKHTTRDENELTGNTTMDRGLTHFTEGLSVVFTRAARALKEGSPFVFTYHHNTIEAYYPVAVAILDAGLKCSASIPCPAEMGASIHINGTGSSIVDTVFVCRSRGMVPRRTLVFTPSGITGLVETDLALLRAAGLKPTRGDIRCMAYGHFVRMALWTLKDSWNRSLPTQVKIEAVATAIDRLGGWPAVERSLTATIDTAPREQRWTVADERNEYEVSDVVSF
jgi:putative DNA methylase